MTSVNLYTGILMPTILEAVKSVTVTFLVLLVGLQFVIRNQATAHVNLMWWHVDVQSAMTVHTTCKKITYLVVPTAVVTSEVPSARSATKFQDNVNASRESQDKRAKNLWGCIISLLYTNINTKLKMAVLQIQLLGMPSARQISRTTPGRVMLNLAICKELSCMISRSTSLPCTV